MRRASAALTAELEAQSERKVSEMCSHPPGLHDEPAAKHGTWPSVTCNPFSLADAATASSAIPAAQNFLPASKSFFNLGGGFRGARPRPAARVPEVAALVEETRSFHVKANGSDEAPMRQQVKNKKLVELRRTRDLWRTRAEAKQRFQENKEEARELFKKAAKFQTENNRGVRAGVQAEGDEWTLQPKQQRRREVFARVDRRAAKERPNRKTQSGGQE